MFWSEKLRPSLKIRLALSYALLFLIFCSGIFILTLWMMHERHENTLDSRLEQIARRAASLHILGRRLENFSGILPAENYPADEYKTLAEKYPGVQIFLTGYNDTPGGDGRPGVRYYTAFVFYKNEYYELRLRRNGQYIYSRQIVPEHNKNSLGNYFSRLMISMGQENIFITMLNRDHSVYLESGRSPLNPEMQKKLLGAGGKLDFGDFRYGVFRMPDGKLLIAGINIRELLVWRNHVGLAGGLLMLLATLAGSFIAFVLTRRFIIGIKQTTLAMKRIKNGDYSYRLKHSPDSDREIKELIQTFNAMNERTENLLREIKMVSDNVAHDLRTPLTRISGMVEMLLSSRELPEDVRNDCVSVAEEVARLKTLVNTIMDISRTNSAPGAIRCTLLDMKALIQDLGEFMEPAFEEKELEFRMELPDDPVEIEADKTMVQRLVSNLLGNALKFTEKGMVKLKLCREGEEVILEVSDTGCGIAPEEQNLVFDRFYRSDVSRHLQGNGLGLALVKAIVNAHGWTIDLSSSPGSGSVFTVKMRNQSSASAD